VLENPFKSANIERSRKVGKLQFALSVLLAYLCQKKLRMLKISPSAD
jgi:hypothetical protein